MIVCVIIHAFIIHLLLFLNSDDAFGIFFMHRVRCNVLTNLWPHRNRMHHGPLGRATKSKEPYYWGGHKLVNFLSLTFPLRLSLCTDLVLAFHLLLGFTRLDSKIWLPRRCQPHYHHQQHVTCSHLGFIWNIRQLVSKTTYLLSFFFKL